jgi:glycosyltransferase involved in cell wall biosynthesis
LKKTFVCYSGTKPTYLDTPLTCERYFSDEPIKKFLYVGQFTYNKCVGETVKALHQAYPKGDFHLTCVGSGGTALDDIKHYIELEHLTDNVSFAGQIDRDEIIKYYDKNECFLMISKSEAFGLVYLEAMARGCICVGTKGQGIDGVIVDGVNGFLCKGGDSEELTSIIKKINALPTEEKRIISKNARHTAEELSDFNVAKNYIVTVLNS